MTEEEIAKEYVDTLLNKDDTEFDKFLDENLAGLKLNEKQAGTLIGVIKGVGICSFLAELKETIKKWKDEWQEQVQKENDESYARTLQTIQLNKAKKIISNLYAICKDNHYPNTSVLMEQAEQFLKECE